MKKRNEMLLILTALIWGISFVAQSAGGDAVGPLSFNCIRSIIGGLVLIPAIAFLDSKGLCHKPSSKKDVRILLTGGGLCGIILCLATNLQQLGISMGTPAGKAGFLTACYIVIVPVLGLFLKRKCGWNVWVSVAITLIGLYLLCMEGSLRIQPCDGFVIICAVLFSFHIMVVDHFGAHVDGVRMSCIQFFVCGILTAGPMLIKEVIPDPSGWIMLLAVREAWIPILYAGICSCGIAYTLQIVGQQGVNPTVASLLMSLESVFSVLAGWIILKESMSVRAISGCAVIFTAVILSQLNFNKTKS